MRFVTRRLVLAMLAAALGLGAGLATLDRITPDHRDPTPAVTAIEDTHASAPRAPHFPVRGVVPAAFFAGMLITAAFAVARILGGTGYPARLRTGRGPAPRAPTAAR